MLEDAVRPSCGHFHAITGSAYAHKQLSAAAPDETRMDLSPRDDQVEAQGRASPRPVLRPYQDDGLADIEAAFRQHRRVLYVAPTGSGKGTLLTHIAAVASEQLLRVMITAHRQEICDQICLTLTAFGVPHGRIAPDQPMTNDLVQVAMVQTLARRLDAIPVPSLLIVDEAHHAVADTWMRIADAWPDARILGFTATPERLDGRGLCDAFDIMVEGPDTADLIAQKWLAPIRYLAPDSRIDLSTVRTTAGDFNAGDLADVMDRDAVTGDVIEHYLRHLGGSLSPTGGSPEGAARAAVAPPFGGRTAIAFCVTVAHAEHVALRFRDAGIPAESIDGSMTPAERRAVVQRLRAGDIRVLTSCEVISEGFDAPAVGGCILLRPTQSLALYRQQVGRCLRPKPDGAEATVLDHVGNAYRHGLPTAPHVWSLFSTRRTVAERSQAAAAASRLRRCQVCDEIFAATAREAPCDGVAACLWAPPRFIERAGQLSEVVAGTWAQVLGWDGRVHHKQGSAPSFRLLYRTNHGWCSEFLPLQHTSQGARWHGQQKWKRLARHRHAAPPVTAAEALVRFQQGELQRPTRLLIERDRGWWTVRDIEGGEP